MTPAELRDHIVIDLERRADVLKDSVKKQKGKSEKIACQIAERVLRVAANDYRNMTIEKDNAYMSG